MPSEDGLFTMSRIFCARAPIPNIKKFCSKVSGGDSYLSTVLDRVLSNKDDSKCNNLYFISKRVNVDCGISQGSNLKPVLLLTFIINNLLIVHGQVMLFVDDSSGALFSLLLEFYLIQPLL
jgi:hypothetical protein